MRTSRQRAREAAAPQPKTANWTSLRAADSRPGSFFAEPTSPKPRRPCSCSTPRPTSTAQQGDSPQGCGTSSTGRPSSTAPSAWESLPWRWLTPIRPAFLSWPELRDHSAELSEAVPASPLLTPDASTWAEAGRLPSMLAVRQGLQRHQCRELLSDALILLTAAQAGLAALTADHDRLQQLAPEGRFIHY